MRANNRVTLCGVALFFSLLVAGCGQQSGRSEDKGDTGRRVSSEPAPEPVLTAGIQAGKLVYEQHCATCHQSNGGGVPNLNPPLAKTEYVTGDVERLVRIVLKGSNEGLTVNGMVYSNAMPPHSFLSDEELAHVLSYIRNSFGNQADTIRAETVANIRGTLE